MIVKFTCPNCSLRTTINCDFPINGTVRICAGCLAPVALSLKKSSLKEKIKVAKFPKDLLP